MTGSRKKYAALAILFLVWGGLAVWQWFTMQEPVKVPLTNVSGRSPVQSASRTGAGSLRVRLDLLSSSRTQRDMAFATPRNIFAPAMSSENTMSVTEVSAEVSQEQQLIRDDLAQFHYLGFVRNEDPGKRRELAVLTRKDDLHVVRIGETIDNHVVVKTITQDSVTLQDRDSRVEYTVLLSEEPALQQTPQPSQQ